MNPGDIYGRYRVIRLIGQGNMGTVYLVTREDTGRQLALKVVPYANSETARENIAVERQGAELQQKLSDPCVVKVFAVHRDFRDLNVEMEYVPGEDLNEIVEKGALPLERAVRIGIQLIAVLCNLKVDGVPVVHCDLKPRNIRVQPDGFIKIMDFGIAKAARNPAGTVNAFQTERYASPERLETGRSSQQSDLWAASVILYEMLAGYHPFQTAPERMRSRILANAGPDKLPASVPQGLINILHKALSRLPEQRYSSALEILQDLRRFESGRQVLAPVPNPDRTERTIPDPRRASSSAPQPTRKVAVPQVAKRGFRFGRVAVGLAAAGAVIAAGFQYRVWKDARDLAGRIERRETQVPDAWKSFETVNKKALRIFPLTSLNTTMKGMLVEAGEKPILEYRRDQSVSREGEWLRASTWLQNAQGIDPVDGSVSADWHVCLGHVKRIRAAVRQKKNHGTPSFDANLANEAREDFERAAKLVPTSPDPHLGLARIYYDLLQDTALGDRETEAAAQLGIPRNDFQKIEKANALHNRAKRYEYQASGFRGLPSDEKQSLLLARDNYQAAVDLYRQAPDRDGIPAALQEATKELKHISDRLSELDALPGGTQ